MQISVNSWNGKMQQSSSFKYAEVFQSLSKTLKSKEE
jgi:hypothetical protein